VGATRSAPPGVSSVTCIIKGHNAAALRTLSVKQNATDLLTHIRHLFLSGNFIFFCFVGRRHRYRRALCRYVIVFLRFGFSVQIVGRWLSPFLFIRQVRRFGTTSWTPGASLSAPLIIFTCKKFVQLVCSDFFLRTFFCLVCSYGCSRCCQPPCGPGWETIALTLHSRYLNYLFQC